jgi:ferredoxin
VARVIVNPDGISFEAEDGQTIMDAAHEPVFLAHRGGKASAPPARARRSQRRNLDQMGRSELKTLTADLSEAAVRARRLRLACQARVTGDVTVTKRGVRPES